MTSLLQGADDDDGRYRILDGSRSPCGRGRDLRDRITLGISDDTDLNELVTRFLAYLDEGGLSVNTKGAYASDLHRFRQFCTGMGLHPLHVDEPELATYLQSLSASGLAPASITRYMLSVQSFFRFLIEGSYLQGHSNPVQNLQLPKLPSSLPYLLGGEDFIKLFAYVDHLANARDRAMVELLYGCGLRVSELAAFKQSDYFPKLGMIRVGGKGDKDRVVPIHRRAIEAVDAYLSGPRKGSSSPVVLLTRPGRPMSRQAIWAALRALCVKANIKLIYPHILRHTFASHMLSGGADLRSIQDMLGHENVTTTQKYTHVDIAHLKRIHSLHPRQ